ASASSFYSPPPAPCPTLFPYTTLFRSPLRRVAQHLREGRPARLGLPRVDPSGDPGPGRDVRTDSARVHDGDPDRAAFLLELAAQRFAEAAQPELARAVGALPRRPDEPEEARGVHDLPLATCQQGRQQRPREADRREQVDLEQPVEVLGAHLGE